MSNKFNYRENIILLSISAIFSIFFCYEFFILLFESINNKINYPSITNKIFFHKNDIDFIYSFSRRSFENLSLFNISSNVFEYQNENYHYLSSRGLGYFLIGVSNLISSDPIKNLLFVTLLFSFLNFYLIIYFTPSNNITVKILITSLVFLFSSMLFGSILNPFHYYDFFFNIDFIERVERINGYSINRLPNILINNIFVFINFFILKIFFVEGFKKNNNKYFLVFFITCFLDTIIYFINISVLILLFINDFIKNKILDKQRKFSLIIIISLIFLMIFHLFNFYLLNVNDYRHGFSVTDKPWTGNIIFAREMIYFPICLIIFFYKDINFVKISLIFLITCLLIFEISKIIPSLEFLSSRITHRNFEFLFSFLSFSLVYLLILKNKKDKIFWTKIIIFYFLHLAYLHIGNLVSFKYLISNLLIILFLTSIIFNKKFFLENNFILKFVKLFSITPFIYLIFMNYSGAKLDSEDIKFHNNQFEKDQKKLFDWSNKNLSRKDILLSFNKGIMINAEIHTGNFIYIPSITKAPISMKRDEIIDRIFDVLYLYGFTVKDVATYLENYNTNWELKNSEHPFDYESFYKKDLALLNFIVFYEKIQTNYNKSEIQNFYLEKYRKYLSDKKYLKMKKFTHCIITRYDQNFIKKNSFFYKLISLNNPIYDNNNIKVYVCSKT